MYKRLAIYILFSAIIHTIVIVVSTLLPTLLGFGSISISESDIGNTVPVATGDENDSKNENINKELIINEKTLNIDVVKKEQIFTSFNDDLAKELGELLKIKEKEKIEATAQTEAKKEYEFNQAISGKNIINIRPLQTHSNVIIENLDFTMPFTFELTFRVNSDGSFRGVEILQSSENKIVDESLKNIFLELSNQKVALFTNFRSIDVSFISDGVNLTFDLTAYFKDDLNASAIKFLLSNLLNASKDNNKNNEETTKLLNNLTLTQNSNALIISINAETLFVKEAIKD